MGFYFITTEHLEDRLWFKDDEDYKVGMNYVAVVSYKCGVKIVVFILMSWMKGTSIPHRMFMWIMSRGCSGHLKE